jgi:hypothetical protein
MTVIFIGQFIFFNADYAGNKLEIVLYAMIDLPEKEIFFIKRLFFSSLVYQVFSGGY